MLCVLSNKKRIFWLLCCCFLHFILKNNVSYRRQTVFSSQSKNNMSSKKQSTHLVSTKAEVRPKPGQRREAPNPKHDSGKNLTPREQAQNKLKNQSDLFSDLKTKNDELLDLLRQKYPDAADQKYLGIPPVEVV